VAGVARSGGSLRIWLGRHLQALLFSVGEMWRAPAATALTVSVIAVALAVPAGMQIAVDNLGRLGGGLDRTLQVSLFLQPALDDADATALAGRLRERAGVAQVEVISREQALAEFVRLTGLGDVQALFGDTSPLPAVLVVTPRDAGGAEAAALLAELEALVEVEAVQSDLQWSQRLEGWLELARRALVAFAALLGAGVLLVIGNTVRVAAQGRREEIAVARLCGATDSFIRRPFLYAGLLYGVLGAGLSCLLVGAAMLWLGGAVSQLSSLYMQRFSLVTPGVEEVVLFTCIGGALGLAGAWMAVRRLLAALEP